MSKKLFALVLSLSMVMTMLLAVTFLQSVFQRHS